MEKVQGTPVPCRGWGGESTYPKENKMRTFHILLWLGGLFAGKYGMLFLRGTGMTLLIALTGTALGFAFGLLVAIIRTIALPEKEKTRLERRA